MEPLNRNRDYFAKLIQDSRSSHDYGNSGPIVDDEDRPMTREGLLTIALMLVLSVLFWVALLS